MTTVMAQDFGVTFKEDIGIFHLYNSGLSYAFRISSDGLLEHLHFGSRISEHDNLTYLAGDSDELAFSTDNRRDARLFEFSDYGSGDARIPSYRLTFASDGTTTTSFIYKSHEILDGLPDYLRKGVVPHFRGNAGDTKTLIVHMEDPDVGRHIQAFLCFVIYQDEPLISRFVSFWNPSSTGVVYIEEANSVSTDLPPATSSSGYHFVQLSGSWGRERHPVKEKLYPGVKVIESRRGTSSHQFNPFVIITDGQPSEDSGEVFAFGLMYPSSFKFSAELTHTETLRVTMGIHPEQFRWKLQSRSEWTSPVSIMVFSKNGLGSLTRSLHRSIKKRVLPETYQNQVRPVLINSWEAMYFNVSEENIMNNLVYPAKGLGIDLIVLDDGWFKGRNSDFTSLGDWLVDFSKFPTGLKGLSGKIHKEGFKFGIWMEPEMISRDSDLYRKYPDWALHVKGRPQTEGRHQHILDLSRKEVQEFIISCLDNTLQESKASYLKWDFNRYLTEYHNEILAADEQGELMFRWVQGLYNVLNHMKTKYPQVLFESCSGGGGRFDLSLMYFSHQIWTSDNTDALSRLPIQMGTSLVYPPQVISAHVSTVPNHQVHRSTPWSTRHTVAMAGMLGYELNLKSLSDEERSSLYYMIEIYKNKVAPLVINGDMFRLTSIFDTFSDISAPVFYSWMHVLQNKSEAVVFCVLHSLYEVGVKAPRLKLKGLDPNSVYVVDQYKTDRNNPWPGYHINEYGRLSGSTLMNGGLIIKFNNDADATLFLLKKID
ncbi:hypothetical protein MP638_005272 [Amoeboaphelidium occidentale]|nr:hypothetical protein MP638_005272 [Amoeboaphelidium occidentale]